MMTETASPSARCRSARLGRRARLRGAVDDHRLLDQVERLPAASIVGTPPPGMLKTMVSRSPLSAFESRSPGGAIPGRCRPSS